MIRTLIIEDEPAVRKELQWLVNQEKDLSLLGTAGNVKDAVSLIHATGPELILMDIQLTDGTAFDVLNKLDTVSFRIIFITAYNHFAIKAIKYGALDYLLKPLDEAELKTTLDRIRKTKADGFLLQQEQLSIAGSYAKNSAPSLEGHFVVHAMDYLQVLQLKDVVHCVGDGTYTTVYLQNGKKIMASKPLKYFEELLPERWFVRTHQSYIVNINCIDRLMKSGLVILKDRTEIPVSTRRKDYVVQRLTHIDR